MPTLKIKIYQNKCKNSRDLNYYAANSIIIFFILQLITLMHIQNRNISSNMLQSSQFMSNSAHFKCNQLINKEIDALSAKKDTLNRKIQHEQQKINVSANAKGETQKHLQNLREIQKTIKTEEIRFQKYKLRRSELQNEKLNQIIQFQHLQLQLQAIKQQLIGAFTPQTSTLQNLRLKLIQIQSNEALVKFSNHFSIRKAVISFAKKKLSKKYQPTAQPLQFEICKRNLITQFRDFVYETLRNKKLSDFNKIFSQPLENYLTILQQVTQMLMNHTQAKDQDLVEQQQSSLIREWKSKKAELLSKKLQVQTLQLKIDENFTKIQKHEDHLKQALDQKKQIQKIIKYYTTIKEADHHIVTALPQLKLEMQQLDQAITYFTFKRNQKQTHHIVDSPISKLSKGSKGLIDTLDQSSVSKNLTIQNCQSLRSHLINQSSKHSKLSLFKSPNKSVVKDKSMKILKIFSSPHLK